MSHVKYKPHRSTHERLQRTANYLHNNPSDDGNPELGPFLGQGDYLNRFKANITNPLFMTLLKYDLPCNQDFIDSKNAIRKEHIGALFQNLYTIEQIVNKMGSVYTEYCLNVLQGAGDVLLVYNDDKKQMTIAFLCTK